MQAAESRNKKQRGKEQSAVRQASLETRRDDERLLFAELARPNESINSSSAASNHAMKSKGAGCRPTWAAEDV